MGIQRSMTCALGLTVALVAPGALAQVAYPAKGQSDEQQSQDMGECRAWATKSTGFDPNTPPPQYVPPRRRQGGAAGGAVFGAALGAIAGGDSSSAGKGAAIGGVFGGARQAMGNKEAQERARANHDQAMAYYQQRRDEHERAQGACLEARGYTVR